eukprot:CAMPEP_0202732888 /NCGR_PEP_ID=MMETSP1385-20130828/187886_1 /ASSEMBLY_ACC=CAM_ASM_000861 /TAXON_ID=933848 /ORGANISM="Elphidium margaritaceum" /LENGTH=921 /DNA_ID=CAMNT_0049399211 /DNA_START=46 /DNA_END=2811 /DNA_ORIENTATION=+
MSSLPQRRTALRRNRSDSHYNASTPLVVKKYNNLQLDSLVKNKKPLLITAVHDLPLLSEITDENECSDILVQKLSLCEVVCNYRMVDGYLDFESAAKDVTVAVKAATVKLAAAASTNTHTHDDNSTEDIEREIQCIHNKALLLKECVQYLTKTKWSSLFTLQAIFRVVQTNLFRSLPDSFIIGEFQGVDKPQKYALPSWCHLQLVYELMFQVVLNKTIDISTLTSYLNGSFLNNFVQLFHSLCVAEVEYVKISLHSMYMDFPKLRDEIRISISQYCWSYIYASHGTPEGVHAILDIMHSILQGVDDDKLNDPQKWLLVLCHVLCLQGVDDDKLNDPQKWLLVLCHVLCPLHKGSRFDKFRVNLYKCIQTFLRANPDHLVMVLNNGLLRFWPQTNPEKEQLFVKQLASMLKHVKRATVLCTDTFTDVFASVLLRVQQNLASSHFKIVDETIELLKDKLIRQCIEYHGGESGWKAIYVCLIRVAHTHYLYLTRNNSQQIMDWLKKYRITKKYVTIFEKLEQEYREKEEEEKTQPPPPQPPQQQPLSKDQQQLTLKWQRLRHMAHVNQTELARRTQQMQQQQQQLQDSTRNRISLDHHLEDSLSPKSVQIEKELALLKYFLPTHSGSDEDDIKNHFQFNPLSITQRALTPSSTTPAEALSAAHPHTSFGAELTLHAGASMFDRRSSQPMMEPVTPSIHIFAKRASALEQNYGYPMVHQVFKRYHADKRQHCKNPTHLVLFAKKCAIAGVTFAKANKYFKARRETLKAARLKKKKKQKKKVPLVPSAIETGITSSGSSTTTAAATHSNGHGNHHQQHENGQHNHHHHPHHTMPSKVTTVKQSRSENDVDVSHYRRKLKRPSGIQSPIINQIRLEKRLSEDSMASNDSSVLSPTANIPTIHTPKETNLAHIAEDANVTPTPSTVIL